MRRTDRLFEIIDPAACAIAGPQSPGDLELTPRTFGTGKRREVLHYFIYPSCSGAVAPLGMWGGTADSYFAILIAGAVTNPSYPFAATSSHFCRYAPTPPIYGRKTLGLPGIFAPMYHDAAFG
jgi:hypothetical protein